MLLYTYGHTTNVFVPVLMDTDRVQLQVAHHLKLFYYHCSILSLLTSPILGLRSIVLKGDPRNI